MSVYVMAYLKYTNTAGVGGDFAIGKYCLVFHDIIISFTILH